MGGGEAGEAGGGFSARGGGQFMPPSSDKTRDHRGQTLESEGVSGVGRERGQMIFTHVQWESRSRCHGGMAGSS